MMDFPFFPTLAVADGMIHFRRSSARTDPLLEEILNQPLTPRPPGAKVPQWPEEFLGSVTHKSLDGEDRYWAAYVVPKTATAISVGIDLERVFSTELHMKIHKRWNALSREPHQALRRIGNLSEEQCTTALFALFEVAVKCAGNAELATPPVPQSFTDLRFAPSPTPEAFQFTLKISAHPDLQISGRIVVFDEWVLCHAKLTR